MTRPPYHRVNPTRPRPGRVPKQRSAPPPRSTSGRGSKVGGSCLLVVAAAVAVLSISVILMPLAARVWTTEFGPASDRVHYGDGLIVAMALAGFGLYIAMSLLTTRRPISPAGSVPVLRGAGTSSRSGTDAAGVVCTSPGPTPAATTAGAA